MNIFALHPDPAICASMHCDQHLHKMILESAQMLCTAAGGYSLYAATHKNHPCTKWVAESRANALWLLALCEHLDDIRMSLGSDSHKSLEIARSATLFIKNDGKKQTPFIFAGPDELKYLTQLTVHQKYQQLYVLKHKQWLGTRNQMSYKNRPLPEFLSEYSSQILHRS